MNNKSVFAKNLKHYMKVNKKTRKDVCNALGFSYYTFSDWVNGKKYPRMDKVEMLANYFNISKSDLIEENNEQDLQINNLGKSMLVKQFVNSGQVKDADKFLERLKRFKDVVGVDELTDTEMDELIDYAKYIISKRKKD